MKSTLEVTAEPIVSATGSAPTLRDACEEVAAKLVPMGSDGALQHVAQKLETAVRQTGQPDGTTPMQAVLQEVDRWRNPRSHAKVLARPHSDCKVRLLANGQIQRSNGQVVSQETLERQARENPRAMADLQAAQDLIWARERKAAAQMTLAKETLVPVADLEEAKQKERQAVTMVPVAEA